MRHAVILAGGWGERLWPMSTRSRPKQLLALGGQRPLVAETLDRVLPLVTPETSLVLTSASLRDALLPEISAVPPERVVGEPVGKNTAPAIALAAHILAAADPDAIMFVLPADHIVGDVDAFREALEVASRAALDERALITLGIHPVRAETGYGYIQSGRPAATDGALTVERFVEKPDAATAAAYVAEGSYLWNSGMFVWRADRVLEEIEAQLPDLASALDIVTASPGDDGFLESVSRFYAEAPAVSIDYGIMENAEGVLVVPVGFGWDDVGAWPALARVWGVDESGNAVSGETVLLDSEDSVVYSEDGLVAVLGMSGVVIARTSGATLVCPKDRASDVRRVVEELKRRGLIDNH
jgi:mannose-1-phosphate guanylyltransferase